MVTDCKPLNTPGNPALSCPSRRARPPVPSTTESSWLRHTESTHPLRDTRGRVSGSKCRFSLSFVPIRRAWPRPRSAIGHVFAPSLVTSGREVPRLGPERERYLSRLSSNDRSSQEMRVAEPAERRLARWRIVGLGRDGNGVGKLAIILVAAG